MKLGNRNAIWSAALFVGAMSVGLTAPLHAQVQAEIKEGVGEGKVTPDGEKIICKKMAQTGSLVKKKKVCYTREQWDRIAQAARANGQRMQSDHTMGVMSN